MIYKYETGCDDPYMLDSFEANNDEEAIEKSKEFGAVALYEEISEYKEYRIIFDSNIDE